MDARKSNFTKPAAVDVRVSCRDEASTASNCTVRPGAPKAAPAAPAAAPVREEPVREEPVPDAAQGAVNVIPAAAGVYLQMVAMQASAAAAGSSQPHRSTGGQYGPRR